MKPVEFYRGREQTYLKHFFLENYLEKLAFHIAMGWEGKSLMFVDGFSGPWKSEDDKYEDTSFKIAIDVLRRVRDSAAEKGHSFTPKCIFIERESRSYAELENAISGVRDFSVESLWGDFESLIPSIVEKVAGSFALNFVDPTGWTGFALERIKPLLQHQPGEVLINFMFSFLRRFLSMEDLTYSKTFDDLFAGGGWEPLLDLHGDEQEEAVIDLYCRRLSQHAGFRFTTYTRILNPLKNATYFYLVYGTRHPKGLYVFRDLERKFVEVQEKVRTQAKQAHRISTSGQEELFDDTEYSLGPQYYARDKDKRMVQARSRALELIKTRKRVSYDDIRDSLLHLHLIFPEDVQAIVQELRKSGVITIAQLKPRERTCKEGYMIERV